MNFESLKMGFLSYLEEKINSNIVSTDTENQAVQTQKQIPDSEISIFLYSDEFKDYLVQEIGADSSIFSKSINEIMDMEIVNGKLVDTEETNSDSFESGQSEQSYAENVNMSANTQQTSKEATQGESQAMVPPTPNDVAGLTKNALNDAFSNETVIGALDSDKTGELSEEEINNFLQGIKSQNENGDLTFDDISNALKNIIQPEDKESTNPIDDLLNKIYENKTVQKALDIDGDGKLSDEEKAKFLDYIKENLTTDGELTEEAIKAAFDSIIDGTFSYDTEQQTKAEQAIQELQNEPQPLSSNTGSTGTSGSSGASGSGGVSGSSGASGGSGVSGGGSSTGTSGSSSSSNVDKGMTLEELESERKTKESELKNAQQGVNDVYSGENEAVKNAQEDCDKAKEDYDKAVEEDENISDELKQQRKDNLDAIAQQEEKISNLNIKIHDKDSEISSMTSQLTSDESNLAALEESLSALEGQTSDDSEKQGEIDSKKAALKTQIEEAKQKVQDDKDAIEKLEQDKKTLEDDLKTEEGNLRDLEKDKTTIEKSISEVCKPETKEAMDAYNSAKDNVNSVKESELKTAQSKETEAQEALDEINAQIDTKKAEETKKENSVSSFDLDIDENLTDYQKQELEQLEKIFEENKDKYEEVAEATGMPAELICAIHYRESSNDFSTYLHNGEPLGQTTTLEPPGIYFTDWTEAAIDAINREKSKVDTSDGSIESYLRYAEAYNGDGYRNRGIASPYVWAGTTKYTGGLFVSDRNFSASTYDKRLGVAVIMKHLME